MLNSLDSSFPSFQHIDFKPGVNIILAEGDLKQQGKKGTANSVGKSSVFRLIDFLLGGKLDDKELPVDTFGLYQFTLDATIGGRKVSVTRSADKKERKYIEIAGAINGWSLVTEEEVNATNLTRKFDLKHWTSILGACEFDLPSIGSDGTASSNKAPTPREMFTLFNRKSFKDINKSSPQQGLGKGRRAIAYLLGLDWEYLVQLADLVKEEATVKSIQDTARFEMARTCKSQKRLECEYKKLTEQIKKAEDDMSKFQVDLGYVQIEKEVDELTTRLLAAQRRATNARRRIDLAQRAKERITDDPKDLEHFYETLNITLGGTVKHRLEEVKNFHDQIQANRLSILNSEIVTQEAVEKAAKHEAEECDGKRAALLQGVEDTSNALKDFHVKQNALTELRAQYERDYRSLQLFEDAKKEQQRIDESRATCIADARPKFEAKADTIKKLCDDFKKLIESMYTRTQGELKIEFKDGSVKVKGKGQYGIFATASVSGDNGAGKGHMKVCAFDLLAFAHSRRMKRGMDFLMHDTPAFEATDPNQISQFLVQVDTVMKESEGQYICAIDKDRFDQCCSANAAFAEIAKRANLIHLSETHKLFGINFN